MLSINMLRRVLRAVGAIAASPLSCDNFELHSAAQSRGSTGNRVKGYRSVIPIEYSAYGRTARTELVGEFGHTDSPPLHLLG